MTLSPFDKRIPTEDSCIEYFKEIRLHKMGVSVQNVAKKPENG